MSENLELQTEEVEVRKIIQTQTRINLTWRTVHMPATGTEIEKVAV